MTVNLLSIPSAEAFGPVAGSWPQAVSPLSVASAEAFGAVTIAAMAPAGVVGRLSVASFPGGRMTVAQVPAGRINKV